MQGDGARDLVNPEMENSLGSKAIIRSSPYQYLTQKMCIWTDYSWLWFQEKAKALLTDTCRQILPTSRHFVRYVVSVACRHCTFSVPEVGSGLSAYRRFKCIAGSISHSRGKWSPFRLLMSWYKSSVILTNIFHQQTRYILIQIFAIAVLVEILVCKCVL